MNKQLCSGCEKPKANLQCGLCQAALCKSCAEFLEDDSFSLLPSPPPEATHSAYCRSCMSEKITPLLVPYQELVEKAKDVAVYSKAQGKETRMIKREHDTVRVVDCLDRDETVLRLAVAAVQVGCNAIIDVNLTSRKIKDGSYSTTKWSGTGIPAQIRTRF